MQKRNYEVEVLVNGRPIKEYFHRGKHYIEGKRDTTFSLKLRNNTWQRKLFVPSIDGLSVMNGEEASFDSSGYIVSPYSSITIDGWRISDDEVAEFYFSSAKDSYRKRMKRGNNLGLIGVVVFEEKSHQTYTFPCTCGGHGWGGGGGGCSGTCHDSIKFTTTTSDNGPEIMCLSNSGSDDSNSGSAMFASASCSSPVSQELGTGFGDTRRSEVTSIGFERCNRPDATFEIYYNTREELEKAGVRFRSPVYVTPQAFPGEYCKAPRD